MIEITMLMMISIHHGQAHLRNVKRRCARAGWIRFVCRVRWFLKHLYVVVSIQRDYGKSIIKPFGQMAKTNDESCGLGRSWEVVATSLGDRPLGDC